MKLTIAVTGINATDNPGPGSGVIRSIRFNPDFQGKIIGLAYDTMDPGIYQPDLVDIACMIPYPSQDPGVLFERIATIHQRYPIDVLIPTLDAELLNFIEIEEQLKKIGIAMLLPTREQFEMRSKDQLQKLCEKIGINTPKTTIVTAPEQFHQLELNYPVYVKGRFYDAYRAYSPGEAIAAFHKISARWGLPVIVQEQVSGEEFDIVALGDGSGSTIGAVAMKKMSLTGKGKAWAGISIDNDRLIEITRKLIEVLRWRGGVEVELIHDQNSDCYYLLEINPRFPAWCYLAPGVGQNLPEALVRIAQGEEIKPFIDYRSGVLFIRYASEVLTDINTLEQVILTGFRGEQ